MKQQERNVTKDKRKMVIIYSLYAGAVFIIFLGLFFSAYSILNNVSIKVLHSNIHGIVFGLLVVYLGVRYYLSVDKFKTELYQSSSEFTWSNFKREKKNKANFVKKKISIIRR